MTARRADDLYAPGAPPEERELVLAFKAGKEDAYREIYDLYMPRARSICRRMLGDDQDAQEACQEVFLRVFQSLPRFNGRYQLGAWIARIATNHCLDVLRARTRRPGDTASFEELADLPDTVPDRSDPEIAYIRKSEGRRVRRVLDSLPPLHRAAIVLRDFEGLSYDEISSILGISECQLKALLHRARKGFRRSWPVEALSALIPARLLGRVRRAETSVRDGAPVPGSQAGAQLAEVVSSAAPAATSCAGMLQQCGQMMTERVAAIVTVAVVGTASVGAAAVLPSDGPDDRREVRQRITLDVSDSGGGSQDRMGRAATVSANEDEGGKPNEEEVSQDETTEPPVPAESPAPAETPPPAPPPADEGGGAPASGPSPAPSPSQIPEPTGYGLDVRVDVPPSSPPCSCQKGPATLSERVYASERGVDAFQQVTEGAAAAAGNPSYGVRLEHGSNNGTDHSARLVLQSREGSYTYDLSGKATQRRVTDWGGHIYRYEGRYANTGRPSTAERMPNRGSYVIEVTVSWRQNRITHVALDLAEG